MAKSKAVRPSGSKDKQPRKHGGGMPKKPDKEKSKSRTYSATDTEEQYIRTNFTSTTKLVKQLVRKEIIVKVKK